MYIFNTLKQTWDNGKQLHQELDLKFSNKVLVSYKVEPTRVQETYTKEIVDCIVDDLVNRGMITFYDDVPNMLVSVPIQEIGVPSEEGNDSEPLYIETFHMDMDNDDNDLHQRGCDVPVPLHKYLWLERELNHTDM